MTIRLPEEIIYEASKHLITYDLQNVILCSKYLHDIIINNVHYKFNVDQYRKMIQNEFWKLYDRYYSYYHVRHKSLIPTVSLYEFVFNSYPYDRTVYDKELDLQYYRKIRWKLGRCANENEIIDLYKKTI